MQREGPARGTANPFRSKTYNLVAVLACALLLLPLSGCQRTKSARLTPAQIHQITEELAQAAADKAPAGSVVKSRRARARPGVENAEQLYIGLRGASVRADQIEQTLAGIAARHGLRIGHELAGADASRMILRWQAAITHRIEIEQLAGTAERSPALPGRARLAILVDDLGSDRNAAEAVFALRLPLTVSVLPFHIHSREIAHQARQHGCEVMLHLPMQSLAGESPEPLELRPGLAPDELRSTVGKMLDAVPEADGVNNHQGSEATADPPLMSQLMRVLKDEDVFYVDSRTTRATVAFDAAKREGVRAAFRNVPFLDDVQNKDAIKRQLRLAIEGAKQKGEAIAIGHPHSETLAALREMLPGARKEGVELVLVSEVVH